LGTAWINSCSSICSGSWTRSASRPLPWLSTVEASFDAVCVFCRPRRSKSFMALLDEQLVHACLAFAVKTNGAAALILIRKPTRLVEANEVSAPGLGDDSVCICRGRCKCAE
jgi:hypothetical protein